MGRVVAACAVPHTPAFPGMVAAEDTESFTARQFGVVRDVLERAQVDAIVLFDSDHANTFFLDNLPTFAVGVASSTSGPNDMTAGLPNYSVPMDADLGQLLLSTGIESGFDLSVTQEFTVDHSVLVPLHFLTPAMDIPVVPVFINGIIHPIPRSSRAFALGQMIGGMVAGMPADRRVAVVSSGSVSHEVGGPRIQEKAPWGVPDPGWLASVAGYLQAGDPEPLLAAATTARMFAAGDVAGELLNLIALLGAGGVSGAGLVPAHLETDPFYGHAFAAWEWAS
jgi:aromatic ring-opening dioxygenase catalytic subunit (LigB family)